MIDTPTFGTPALNRGATESGGFRARGPQAIVVLADGNDASSRLAVTVDTPTGITFSLYCHARASNTGDWVTGVRSLDGGQLGSCRLADNVDHWRSPSSDSPSSFSTVFQTEAGSYWESGSGPAFQRCSRWPWRRRSCCQRSPREAQAGGAAKTRQRRCPADPTKLSREDRHGTTVGPPRDHGITSVASGKTIASKDARCSRGAPR